MWFWFSSERWQSSLFQIILCVSAEPSTQSLTYLISHCLYAYRRSEQQWSFSPQSRPWPIARWYPSCDHPSSLPLLCHVSSSAFFFFFLPLFLSGIQRTAVQLLSHPREHHTTQHFKPLNWIENQYEDFFFLLKNLQHCHKKDYSAQVKRWAYSHSVQCVPSSCIFCLLTNSI